MFVFFFQSVGLAQFRPGGDQLQILALNGEQLAGRLTDGGVTVNRMAGIQGEEVFVIVPFNLSNTELVIGQVHSAFKQKMALIVFFTAFEQNLFIAQRIGAEMRQQLADCMGRQFVKRNKTLDLRRCKGRIRRGCWRWIDRIFHGVSGLTNDE